MNTIVLIPAHNEAKTIGPLVAAIRTMGIQVVVFDDGSQDGTGNLAETEGAHVLHTTQKSGKGNALKMGFEYCIREGYEVIIAMDGDGQHSPLNLPSFLECFQKTHADVVTGNRMENPRGMPPVRLWTNRFMSWIISKICHQQIPDTQCGYRLMSTRLLKSITIECSDFEIETEILIKASKAGYKIASVPIESIYRDEVSKIRPVRDTLRFISYISRELLCK
jgi:glycosyltransferase involved in cell wall biosynthesis